MKYRYVAVFLASWLLATGSVADVLRLKADHPERYIVKKGDTLWDISGHFLQKPWLWPRLWHLNPQVRDPHWIYPGDVLRLVWVDGEPRLVNERVQNGQKREVRLSPGIRIDRAGAPVPALSYHEISSFLQSDHLLPVGSDFKALPWILGNNDNVTAMLAGQQVYVKGYLSLGQQYGIYRPGKVYRDPETNEELGQAAVLTGMLVGKSREADNTTRAEVVKNYQEVLQGDRLMLIPDRERLDMTYTLQPAQLTKPGHVLDFGGSDDVTATNRNGVLILDRGARDGLKNGDVLSIRRIGVTIAGNDADSTSYQLYSPAGKRLMASAERHLPDEVIGEAMVFKTYDKLSMALVLQATDAIKRGALVGNPAQ